jgi:valyl-tRNA synthetase
MDTWATSSLTPLINMKFGEKENYEKILRPMGLRANASEIIRTWDFYTIVKSYYHFNEIPWENAMISGFALADKGEKISKSKGNSKSEPIDIINNYSADAVRYWAATGRLGMDIYFSEETILRGKKLINKIWNVSKFIEMHLADFKDSDFKDFETFDKWIINEFNAVQKKYINYLENYEVGLALNCLEEFFWNFCDDYIEIVKHRLYRPEEFGDIPRYSGQKTVYMLLYKLLQDFSIFFPFITEEIFTDLYKEKSIHLTKMVALDNDFASKDYLKVANAMLKIINEVRKAKSENNVSLKTTVELLDVTVEILIADEININKDFKATLFIENIKTDIKENVVPNGFQINEIVLKKEA